jgi:LmbE family N-acetylglucosaminyl deacetylase
MNVLAFFAHPDDETMLAGGTLALLAQNGEAVHYLCATRGEGGEVGEPPLCTQEQLGEVREKELVCAVRALGGRSLTFLGYIDPRVGPQDTLFAYSDNMTMLAGQVAASIRQFDAQVVISHGSNGEYGHPAHQLSHQAARIAVESLGESGPGFYTTAAIFPDHPRPRLANQDDPADLVLDVSPVLPQKTQAALCHRTQHALFVRRASEEAGRRLSVPEVIMKVESLRRWKAAGGQAGQDGLTKLLNPYLKSMQSQS